MENYLQWSCEKIGLQNRMEHSHLKKKSRCVCAYEESLEIHKPASLPLDNGVMVLLFPFCLPVFSNSFSKMNQSCNLTEGQKQRLLTNNKTIPHCHSSISWILRMSAQLSRFPECSHIFH